MQQHKTLIVVLLGLFALLGYASASQAAEPKARKAAVKGERKVILLQKRASGYGRSAMRGGYSYGKSDVVVPLGHSRAPYAVTPQSPGGPFDSGFFFDSDIAPLNNAPYPK